jgi:hypothetical protein
VNTIENITRIKTNNMEYTTLLSTQLKTGEITDDTEVVSNCCGANTTEPCRDGLAFCLDCKEHCSVEPVEKELDFDERY